jgi:hypothetical protein
MEAPKPLQTVADESEALQYVPLQLLLERLLAIELCPVRALHAFQKMFRQYCLIRSRTQNAEECVLCCICE